MEEMTKFSTLRQRAEAALSGRPIDLSQLSLEDAQNLIHELQVYHIELELQNEELQNIQQQLEESRNKYADLYDFAPVGYFTIDNNGLIKEANLTGARMLGHERGALIKRPLSQFIAKVDQDIYYRYRQAFPTTQPSHTCELRLVRKDESQFYARLEGVTTYQGPDCQYRIAVSDITDRKEAEEALQQARDALEIRVEERTADLKREIFEREQTERALQASEERYKQLVHSVTDYIYTVKVEQGRAVATSHGPNCLAVTGYTSQEYENDPNLWYQMIYEEDRNVVTEHLARLLAGETVPPVEHRLLHKDGSTRWVRHTLVLRKNKEGVVVAYDGLITDITERKRLEKRLAAIHRVGQELTRLRDEETILQWTMEATKQIFQCEGAGYGLIDETTGQLENSYYFDGLKSSELSVPMKISERVIGVLNAVSAEPNHFTPDDQQLLQTLADQTTVAIENARLYQEVHQRAEAEHAARKQAEMLREATTALASTIDLNEVLGSILTHLERVVPYDSTCIFLWEGEWLHAVAGQGDIIREEVFGRRYSLEDILHRKFDPNGQPLILINRLLGLGSDDSTPGWMGIPLRVRGEIIGYLTLDNRNPAAYSQSETALAQAFANKAAVAIQNAQLFEKVRTGQEQLRSLSRRLVELQETERRQIARELHDEVGQALTGLMVGLSLVARDADRPETTRARVAELERTTDGVFESLHRLAMNLRPASLDHLGLVAALRQYIETFSTQYQQPAQFEVVGFDDKRLPLTAETNIYRIVQEALTNVIRHAQATQVDVVLKQDGDQLLLIVEDNGIGFDSDIVGKNNRLGLLGMRERAEMLGGKLVVESTIGTGTTILVEVNHVYSRSDR